MNASINRQELTEALRVVCGVLAPRTTKPILQCVLIQVEKDHAVVGATDLELNAKHVVNQIAVTKPGTLAVSADKLLHIVQESSDDTLDLEADERTCHVRGADSHFKLFLQDPAEFPAITDIEGAKQFEVTASTLHSMVTWTTFAAARENTRYAINGVLWDHRNGWLNMVATDGRRLSLARNRVKGDEKLEVSAIAPTKFAQLFQKLGTRDDESVTVRISENQIGLKTERATIGAALIEGRFPNYRDVIPDSNPFAVEVRTQDLLSAIRRAALLTNEESKGVRLAFDKGLLSLSSRAPEQGEARITMAVDYDGDPLEIGFNPVFLSDVLRITPDEKIRFEFDAPDRPGVFKSGSDFVYVAMPINLS